MNGSFILQRRRSESEGKGAGGTVSSEERLRGKRRSQAADKALRERYFAVLQRRDGSTSLAERIKTLRRMVLSQGDTDITEFWRLEARASGYLL